MCLQETVTNVVHYSLQCNFLSQVHQPAAGFLKSFMCGHQYVYLYMCVCPPLSLLITGGVIWCDIDPT